MRPDPPDEPIDLTPQQRRRIDEVFDSLATADDHGVIGVPPGSDAATIRRAYYERVSEFHPDRFFRKRVGRYLVKIEAISRRVTDAYEALSSKERRVPRDPGRRAAPPPPAAPAPSPSPAPAARGPKPGSPQADALRALKDQLDARRAEAKRLVADAERSVAHGDRAGAAEAYRKAAALSPNDPAIAAAHRAMQQAVGTVASEAHARQAELEERFGHWAEAARTWRLVVDAFPDRASGHERLATALLRSGSDAGEAVRAAERAVELEPNEPRHGELLARARAAEQAAALGAGGRR